MNLAPSSLEPIRLGCRARGLRSEEVRGAELLQSALQNSGHKRVEWSQGDDPPDFDFMVDDERWAVEVTYVDQQVPMFGSGSANQLQSRQNWSRKTRALGEDIQRAAKDHLQRHYVLTLPSCPPGQAWSKWKRVLTQKIVEHICSGGGDLALDTLGRGHLKDCGPGASLTITMLAPLDGPRGQLSTDIAAAELSAFEDAFGRKCPKLAKLTGYSRIVLLLVNKYWYHDQFGNHSRAAGVVSKIAHHYPDIDGVYFQIRDDIRRIG